MTLMPKDTVLQTVYYIMLTKGLTSIGEKLSLRLTHTHTHSTFYTGSYIDMRCYTVQYKRLGTYRHIENEEFNT